MFTLEEELESRISIKIVGIGRKGTKAVSKMTHCIEGVEFIFTAAGLTEKIGLSAHCRIIVVDSIVCDCAVGGDVTGCVTPRAESIADAVRDTDLVFIVTDLENQADVDFAIRFVQEARDAGALTLVVPLGDTVQTGLMSCFGGVPETHQLSSQADSMLILSNDSLVPLYGGVQGIFSETGLTDYLVRHAVGQIVQCLMEHGIICIDFADIKAIFGDGDGTYMGLGLATGPTKEKNALLKAVQGLSQQGLDITRANGLLAIVEGSTNMTMEEFDEVSRVLVEMIPEDLNIIFGCFFDDALGENMRVTVFATFKHEGIQDNATF